MTAYFADTSAFAKRYINETGSYWVKSWITPANHHAILISELSLLEFSSILARHNRNGLITLLQFKQLQKEFLAHCYQEYQTIKLRTRILNLARSLMPQHSLRSLDGIQLATAITIQRKLDIPITFVSADSRLLAVAATVGFTTDDPNLHP